MSLADLRRLEDAWAAEHPQQARDGEIAIAGFSYQFLEVLLASVRAWLDPKNSNHGDPRVYGEYLSDIAEARASGVLVVMQIKYTQSSGAVIGALAPNASAAFREARTDFHRFWQHRPRVG